MNKSDSSGAEEQRDTAVVCTSSQGLELRGTPLHFGTEVVAFELYHPDLVLQLSEVLDPFQIIVESTTLYAGRAVVTKALRTGATLVCEANLGEAWTKNGSVAELSAEDVRARFREFLSRRQSVQRIQPDYKLVVAELQTLFCELRLWANQIELQLPSAGGASPTLDRPRRQDRVGRMEETARTLLETAVPMIDRIFDRFEEVSEAVGEPFRAAHRAFAQRQLHGYLLSSPFIYRTYSKPLGYAGDYEMINMIVRNRLQGDSLFAKLIDGYLLEQPPPRAVRSRVTFLLERMVEETCRVSRLGRKAQIYSLGCGPAREVEQFLSDHPLAREAQFTLLDFNDETLEYVRTQLANKHPAVKVVKNSVQNLLKNASSGKGETTQYDLIYCSGLYDYLSDRVCRSLNGYLYDRLAPGGKLVVGNFAPWTPRQHLMEDLSEWFLIYRDAKQLGALAPERAPREGCVVWAEPTGSNIFLEVRKGP